MDGNLSYLVEENGIDNLKSLLITTAVILCSLWLAKIFWSWKNMQLISSKIQGPKGYPLFGNAFDFLGKSADDIFATLMNLFQMYPGITKFWLGNKLVIPISQPEYLEIVLNHPDCLEKNFMYNYTKFFLGNGLFSAPVSIWKKNRKLLNPTFNKTILDSFMGVFNQQSKELLEVLAKNSGKTFDIFPLLSAYNVDNVSETLMGVKFEKPSQFSEFGEYLDEALKLLLVRGTNIWYHSDFIFNFTNIKKTLDHINQTMRKFTHKEKIRLGEEITDDEKWPPLLEYLLQLSKDKKEFSLEHVHNEINTFMVAGTDTSAGTLAFFFVALGALPDIQQKIYNEVIEVIGEDRDVNAEDLPKFEYMERTLKESMRLFTVTPLIMRTASENVVLGDATIPAGSTLLLFTLDTHRNPRYWKDPLKFDPDRFLPDNIAERHPYTFLPFSGGPRGCIGFKYAMMSMKALIALMIRKMEIKSEFKSIEDIELTFNPLLKPKTGFNISVQLRA
ncbi:hypothetical protein WA026_019761 [Henosepilachna vigintioctopunctata]|uniref:Cytochrome P450 n=1 Tax=Henosepilachna vigintioctopunctata TaxID=420089 RepID=A0AAW1UQI2_9CUCU